MTDRGGFCPSCGVATGAEVLRCPTCGVAMPVEHDPLGVRRLASAVGRALGPGYQVVEELGRGGFARVFRVRDLTLERCVAVKVLAPELAAAEHARERFRREALTVAKLAHPNIVPIYFVPAVGDVACYVMPLVDGEPLSARLAREGTLPLPVAVSVVQDVAAALDVAHRGGVIHRDVKPGNILLEAASGRALLTDFGIAKAVDISAGLSSSGFVVGTPQYLSPEQAAGERDLDGRSDEYGLAVVCFEMLAGEPPFHAASPQALYAMHVAAPVPEIRHRRPDVPEGVSAVLRRALSKDPQDRFETVSDFAGALLEGQGRRSLRVSVGAVVGPVGAGDVALFRPPSAAGVSDAARAVEEASDLAALRDALAAAGAELRESLAAGDGARLCRLVRAVAARRDDTRPALREAARSALAAAAADRGVVETLARHWLGGQDDEKFAAEHALAGLLPEVAGPLLDLARRERRAEIVLLADRIGALSDQAATALASDPSPGVASLLVAALRESQRAGAVVERWLALALRHPHREVRAQVLEAATQRGGVTAERIGRLGLGTREPVLRALAVDALAASRRREAVPDLASVLDGDAEAERTLAARALGRLGVPEAAAALQRALERRKLLGLRLSTTQSAALEALGALPGDAARAALREAAGRTGPLGAQARRVLDRRSPGDLTPP